MTRTAIYARYSSALQHEGSIEDQIRTCRERADREGWSASDIFSDSAISGASVHRPGLQRLLEAVEAGRIDRVLCEALDRLSRDQADVALLFRQLRFHGVSVVTLAEGEINELHVGLKGTMNQLFLKDLAIKTHRGLRGRVEAGRSGGGRAYGYDIVRRLDESGAPVRGERRINAAEARVIRRIFKAFNEGVSPKRIARDLNEAGVPGPRGGSWRDTTIRGHRQRGTGILNNELYVGRMVWNRMRYIKDPASGKRVSRMNPVSDWIICKVPELRIIEDPLWKAAKDRQAAIDATPQVQGIKASRFWEHRRKLHLLTGLLRCGRCGGGFTALGKDYLACSAARKLGTCSQRRSIRRGVLEEAVLSLLQDRLMEPDAVAAFVAEVHRVTNRERDAEEDARKRQTQSLHEVTRKLDGLYDAIAEGLRTPGLKERLTDLEARRAEIEADLATPAPSPVRLHPRLSERYRARVADLAARLEDPEIRQPALEQLRGLIEQVTVHISGSGDVTLELDGAITALIEAGQPGALVCVRPNPLKVVAGAGFEPATFRL